MRGWGIGIVLLLCLGRSLYAEVDWRENDRIREPQKWVKLVGGDTHLCGLDADGVKCWGIGETTPTVLREFQDPYDLFAQDDVTCVQDRTGLHCWQWSDRKVYDYPELFDGRKFTFSNTHYCYEVENEGWRCPAQPWTGGSPLLLPTYYSTWGKNRRSWLAPLGDSEVACAATYGLYRSHSISCARPNYEFAAGVALTQMNYSNANEAVVEAASLGTLICADNLTWDHDRTGREIRLWNLECADLAKTRPDPNDPDCHCQLPYHQWTFSESFYQQQPPLAVLPGNQVCLLDTTMPPIPHDANYNLEYHFQVFCADLPQTPPPHEPRATQDSFHYWKGGFTKQPFFTHPLVFARLGSRICALDEARKSGEILCVDPHQHDAVSLSGYRTQRDRNWFDVGSLTAAFTALAKETYPEKRAFFEALVTAMGKPWSELTDASEAWRKRDVFFLRAARPVLDSLSAEKLADASAGLGRLAAQEARYAGVHDVQELAKLPTARQSALAVLNAALVPLQKTDLLKGFDPSLPQPSRLASAAQAKPVLQGLASDEHAKPYAQVALGMIDFLTAF